MKRRSEFIWLTMDICCGCHWQSIRNHPTNKSVRRCDKFIAQNHRQPNERKNNMIEQTGFALSKVGQIAVRVKDLDRATDFYRDKLGLKHLHQAPSVSVLDCGGITLLLTRTENSAEDHPA